jgi:hypothetical protein
LLAQFGGIPLTPQDNTILTDRDPVPATSRKELITRLLIGRCEMCGHTGRTAVHHIRKLADLDKPGQPERPTWMTLMAKRHRKTLVVCHACHTIIHTGQPPATPTQ